MFGPKRRFVSRKFAGCLEVPPIFMRSVFQDAVASVLRFRHRDEGSSKIVEPQGVELNEVDTKMAKDDERY